MWWRPVSERPEYAQQPGRQFIRLEGTCAHSGVAWDRVAVGDAYVRKDGPHGYREEDVFRLCKDHDIDLGSEAVTHWAPFDIPWWIDGSRLKTDQEQVPE